MSPILLPCSPCTLWLWRPSACMFPSARCPEPSCLHLINTADASPLSVASPCQMPPIDSGSSPRLPLDFGQLQPVFADLSLPCVNSTKVVVRPVLFTTVSPYQSGTQSINILVKLMNEVGDKYGKWGVTMREGFLRGLCKQPLKVTRKRTYFFNVLNKGGRRFY